MQQSRDYSWCCTDPCLTCYNSLTHRTHLSSVSVPSLRPARLASFRSHRSFLTICIPSFLTLYSHCFLAPSPCFPCEALVKQKRYNFPLNFTWSKQNIIHMSNFKNILPILYFYSVNRPFQCNSPFSEQRTSSSTLSIHFEMIWNWGTVKYTAAIPYSIRNFFSMIILFNDSSFYYLTNPFVILLYSNLSQTSGLHIHLNTGLFLNLTLLSYHPQNPNSKCIPVLRSNSPQESF